MDSMATAPAGNAQFNTRNPSVKRILQEMKECQRDDSPELMAEALEDNIFEWHFVVRGAADTEFEGGIYHGRILLPPEYPFKPPSFLMLSPTGRFETGVKVCLSISSHHPEHWQPSWSVRTALVALIAFMQTPGNGAIGSLDYSKDERRELARKSRARPPQFGNAQRQALTDAAHLRMLQREAAAAAAGFQPEAASAAPAAAPASPSAAAAAAAAEGARADAGAAGASEAAASPAAVESPAGQPQQHSSTMQLRDAAVGQVTAAEAAPAAVPSPADAAPAAVAAPVAPPLPAAAPAASLRAPAAAAPQVAVQAAPASWEEAGLTALAVAIVAAIAALLIRKVLVGPAAGYDAASQSSFM